MVAFLLRYIPYVGAISSAFLPALVAFAMFPGWGKALEILGGFIILDQVAAQFAEPFIIGHGIDVSPVALLVSAMYWSWLWGIPGLLLSTPMTACLKVAGDYIPALSFLSILLGADRALDDYHDFYRALLELNPEGARKIAIRYCDENGLERTFDDVIAPALEITRLERAENHISEENQRLILDTTHQLIGEIANRFANARISPSVRVLGVMAPGDANFLELADAARDAAQGRRGRQLFRPRINLRTEICDLVKRFTPDFVLVSCVIAECIPAAIELVTALRTISTRMSIVAAGPAAREHSDELIEVGCSQICASTNEARRTVRDFILQRAKSRSHFGTLLPRRYARETADAADTDTAQGPRSPRGPGHPGQPARAEAESMAACWSPRSGNSFRSR